MTACADHDGRVVLTVLRPARQRPRQTPAGFVAVLSDHRIGETMNALRLRTRPTGATSMARPRVLITISAPHSNHHGVKIIARALLDAGYEVICTDVRNAAEAPSAEGTVLDQPIVGVSFLPTAFPPAASTVPAQLAPRDARTARRKATVAGCATVDALRAYIVFTPGADVSGVVATLRTFGTTICGTPERAC